jgi:hypothetical protein
MGAEMAWTAVDDFLESYVRWRERCDEVAGAYARWAASHSAERFLAFAAYRDALDLEEAAAHSYRYCTQRLRRTPLAVPAT